MSQEGSLHLIKGFIRSLEIELQQVAKQGKMARSWRLPPCCLRGEAPGDDTEGKQENNDPQQSGGTGKEEENKSSHQRHLFRC